MEKSQNNLKLFENKKIRYVWNAEEEEWYFSVVDIVEVLAESKDYLTARKYWNKLKQRLKAEGSELVTFCHQLKLLSADGKFYKTDVLSTKNVLRLIQSIPSPKAEPFKMWLAEVGNEVLNESVDPELSIDRAIQNYRKLGYSEGWINQRIKAIEVRKALTDEWDKSGVKKGKEYALLKKPTNLRESAQIAVSGAEVALDARKSLEKRGGTTISSQKSKEIKSLE